MHKSFRVYIIAVIVALMPSIYTAFELGRMEETPSVRSFDCDELTIIAGKCRTGKN